MGPTTTALLLLALHLVLLHAHIVGPCVQTVSEILRHLNQIPAQHGITTRTVHGRAATPTPLMIFKRRFRDPSDMELFRQRLQNAMRSERFRKRLRLKREVAHGILSECVKQVCLEEKSDAVKRQDLVSLKKHYRRRIGECIANGRDRPPIARVQRQNDGQPTNHTDACFTHQPGKVLVGVVDQTVTDVTTALQCARLCATAEADSDLKCLSAMFYEGDEECILAAESRDTQPEMYVDDPKAIYIHNVCADKETATQSTDVATTVAAPTETTVESIQPSGYDNPDGKPMEDNSANGPKTTTNDFSATNSTGEPDEMPFEANPDQIFYGIQPPSQKPEVIPDDVIDSYGMENAKGKQPPVLQPEYNLARKMFDDQQAEVSKCFVRFTPQSIRAVRIAQISDFNVCVSLCEKCRSCLKGQSCEMVGFSRRLQRCALAHNDVRWQVETDARLGDFVYLRRTC